MSKETTVEWLEESEFYLELAIKNLYSAKEELEELENISDDEWNLSADIETQIVTLNKVKLLIKELK